MFRASLVLAIFFGGLSPGHGQQAPAFEQSFFSGEPVKHPVPLSASLLKMLLSTKEGQEGLEFASHFGKGGNPAKLFEASEIHLASPQEVDLVVVGIPPMRGADNTWFWVVRSAPQNSKILLFAGADSLEIMKRKVNGAGSVRTVWSSPSDTDTVIYDFDGDHYKQRSDKWVPTSR